MIANCMPGWRDFRKATPKYKHDNLINVHATCPHAQLWRHNKNTYFKSLNDKQGHIRSFTWMCFTTMPSDTADYLSHRQ